MKLKKYAFPVYSKYNISIMIPFNEELFPCTYINL